jgi:ubiquinone/menaquinone biosynthesis C-methylase UbiE
MRYDFSESIGWPEFSKEFYEEIDQRFFSDVKNFMPWSERPFDQLLDFDSLHNKDVLEIGVGNGSHAQLISPFCRSYTGIDLTDYAVKSTTERLAHQQASDNSHVRLVRMDAEAMEFPSESFDVVWSWGVIHHSAHTRLILEEINRVLRPGGTAITMVYHRSFWNYYILSGLFSGLFRGTLLKTLSFHQARQKFIDGAIARYYSIEEWRQLVGDLFAVKSIKVFGSKAELIPLPDGDLKTIIKSAVPDSLARLLTNGCRQGMFLVSTLHKPVL